MFAAYTPIEKCVGKEVLVLAGGKEFVGMMSGIYSTGGVPILVITPMRDDGTEHHIPLATAVVTIRS